MARACAQDCEGAGAAKGSPPLIALSDGPKPAGLEEPRENRVAVSVFALVVNDDIRLKNLSTTAVRRLYRGRITNWSQLGGPDLPVVLVSRDANSGTRQVFQRRVLGRGEIEYAYTYGRPPADSRASGFLTCLTRGNGQDVIRTHGHLPCWSPEGLRLCAGTPGRR
ncbi:hypothetical protein AQJ58_32355 [Streptomyces sp. DSM 15324]|nr:hypothetical protein AQJ58_32355 [Streptomyces sp. DSM 15324]